MGNYAVQITWPDGFNQVTLCACYIMCKQLLLKFLTESCCYCFYYMSCQCHDWLASPFHQKANKFKVIFCWICDKCYKTYNAHEYCYKAFVVHLINFRALPHCFGAWSKLDLSISSDILRLGTKYIFYWMMHDICLLFKILKILKLF